ncbi:MAG: DinB family protein [Anaerolineae bacterium]
MLSELDNYYQRIVDLRGQVHALVEGLPAEALNWRPLPPGPAENEVNSLAVLAAHVAGSEHFWIGEVVGRLPATRDRDAEFATTVPDAAGLLRRLEATAAETDEVFAHLVPSALDGVREAGGRTVAVRWCILHVVDHTALHLGHMQLTYQLWQGGQGLASPFWYERLPE